MINGTQSAKYSVFDAAKSSFASAVFRRPDQKSIIRRQLRDAILADEFELVYQPQADMSDHKVRSVEALLRWHSPILGLVSPEIFIPLAEEFGFIENLGNMVIEKACRQASLWQGQYDTNIRIAVNVSYRQMQSSNLVYHLESCMTKYNVSAKNLEIELTESTLIHDKRQVINILNQLRDMGVRTAMDDFGTGYSSLSYLASLPFDMVKIDRSFIALLGINPANTAITEAIIYMCQKLNMQVLAEGVETLEQRDILINNQCDLIQGGLISMPVDADEIPLVAGMIIN